MKHYKKIGWLACLLLLVSCFIPWTYYADINKNFSGFFSEQNVYGKPGIFFVFVATVSAILIFIDGITAKRMHIFLCALNIGYLIRTYILFASCYNAYCPEKKFGMYLLIFSCILLLIVSVFPDTKLAEKKDAQNL